jgi:guanylate kinase
MRRALEEFTLVEHYDYAVVNHDGKAKDAADAIYAIVRSEQHKANRAEGAMNRLFFGK